MKIGIFSETIIYNPPFPSGVSRFFKEITTELAQRGHEVFIFEPRAHSNQPQVELIKKNITVLRTFSITFKFYLNFPVGLPFKEIFFDIPFELDVVHANAPGIAILAGITAYRQQIPRVISYHTPLIQYTNYAPLPLLFLRNRKIVNYLERMVYNQFNLTIVPTQGVRDALSSRGFNGPFGFFPTCLDLQNLPHPTNQDIAAFREKYNISNKKIILFVGRMSPEKGVDKILQMVPSIVKQEPDAHFLMVGKGPFLDFYKNLTLERNLAANVTFTGYLSDYDLFTAISLSRMGLIFVGEAQIFDMTILEYWYYGLPLIIRNAMGIDEVVHHGENGLLFNSLREARDNVLQLLQKDDIELKIRTNCQELIQQKYDIKKCILLLEDLYENAADLKKDTKKN
ncbi:MAG TPA: glycosyltransferase [Candidatus Deferrimicrobium sp.]|nr:glycosyltransferase [Candidatus Deferrimicrobium sp.]